jgi:hypothetical protein
VLLPQDNKGIHPSGHQSLDALSAAEGFILDHLAAPELEESAAAGDL